MAFRNVWHPIFDILLGDASSGIDVSETDDEIIVKGAPPEFRSRFDQVHSSPEKFQSSPRYTLQPAGQAAPVLIDQTYPEAVPLSALNIERLFGALLDEKTRSYLGSFKWEARSAEHLFFNVIPAQNVEALLPVCEPQIKLMRDCLFAASFRQLRSGISRDPQSSVVDIANKALKGPLAPIIDRVIGIKRDTSDGSAMLYLDAGFIRQCVVAPKLTGTGEIRINKQHYANYLCSMTPGVMLKRENAGEARAIFVSSIQERLLRPHPHHVLLMDCSGSMIMGFEEHIKKMIELISKLRELDGAATIDIIPFRDSYNRFSDKGVAIYTPCSTQIKNADLISKYLSNLKADGGTPLYAATISALKNLRARSGQNICVYISTDGAADDKAQSPILSGIATQLSRQGSPVKIYVIAIGACYDRAVAETLISATNGTLIEATGPTNFDGIYAHLRQINLPREIVTVVSDILGRIHQERVSVYAGQPAFSSVPIAVPGSFSVTRDEQTTSFNVRSTPPSLQPAPSRAPTRIWQQPREQEVSEQKEKKKQQRNSA